jgi:hypothetical protein
MRKDEYHGWCGIEGDGYIWEGDGVLMIFDTSGGGNVILANGDILGFSVKLEELGLCMK